MTGQIRSGDPRTPQLGKSKPQPAADLPALTPAQERALIDRWLAGDVEARQELERRHRPWVEPLALRYRWCDMPDKQLIYCAWNGFWKAAPRFDPARGAGLQSFARPRVNGRLLEEARGYSGIRSDAWRIYKPVQAALEELELTAEEATYPRALARLLAQLGRAEPIAKLLAGKKPWSQERLEKAVDESLLYLRRGFHPLVEDDADEEQPGACVSLDRLAVPVEETPSDEERAALMVWLYGRACAALPSRQAARQFLALALLHEVHKLTWAEICLRLAGQPAQPVAEADWKWLWCELYLPDALPQQWAAVQALFAAAPPTLNENGVKQWYKTQKGLVVAGKVRPARRAADRSRSGRKRAAKKDS